MRLGDSAGVVATRVVRAGNLRKVSNYKVLRSGEVGGATIPRIGREIEYVS